MNNTVLAIIELDNFPQIVANRAAWIAEHYESELHLLLCDPSLRILRDTFLVSNAAQEIAGNIETAQKQLLDELKEGAGAAHDIVISSSVMHDRPAHLAIIERAMAVDPIFVVKGTQYRSRAKRATFTFTDWQLIRKLAAPLWLVKPNDWKPDPVIVAAVDPMHKHDKTAALDQSIVDAGKSVAAKADGQLILLHAYQSLAEIGRHAMFEFKPVKLPIKELDNEVQAEHRRKLDALATSNGIDVAAAFQLPGRTSEILPTFARTKDADLVIMGAVARSGLSRRVLGSTAEQVLDHLHCDVLIARSTLS